MFADERKFRFRVVKRCRRFPRFGPVTRLATDTDRPAVSVRVAGNALRTQPEERLVRVGVKNLDDIGILDVFGLMALFARDRLVRIDKREPGLSVIELRLFKSRDLRLRTEMFLVARDTGRGRIRKMEPAFTLYLIVDFNVARQASGAADLLSAFVALRAVRNPFEICVGF